ncbi:MAG: hypothetical protein AAFZ52_14790, partial [Bacteroidota bacterium]
GLKSMNFCSFTWETGRTVTMEMPVIGSMETEAEDAIVLTLNEPMKTDDPVAQFKRSYRVLTAAEQAEFEANMKAELQKKVDAGEITQEQADMGQGFSKMAQQVSYSAAPALGDAAVFQRVNMKVSTPSEIAVLVLVGDIVMEVKADVGGDTPAKSKEVAVAVAKEILAAACK